MEGAEPMKFPVITAVKAISPGIIMVTFDGKKSFRVDLSSDIAEYAVLAPLADWELFKIVRPDEWGHAIRWSDAIDLSADDLWIEAHVQSGQAMSFTVFDAWRKRNNLSLADIARILGISRRTATNYANGLHRIPKMVELACLGWESIQRKGKPRSMQKSGVKAHVQL
jgi:DNA-binding transcriptional regulator YiaG